MHLQQTKRGSRKTGGPQYYFHDLTGVVSQYLRAQGAVPVASVTPYGATPSKFMAVSRDVKLNVGKVVPGRVGHDRIQESAAGKSIGEAIRRWYELPLGDFERIDVEIDILDDKFYLAPTRCKYAGRPHSRDIERPEFPLSFNEKKESQLWRKQLKHVKEAHPEMWRWSLEEICRVAAAHRKGSGLTHPDEKDLLRASGPLKVLGVELGPYVKKGYDCQSRFQFLDYEAYDVPIEIKKESSDFKYQQKRYSPEQLSRVVILCVRHDLVNVPANVDVVELAALCSALGQ